MPRKFVESFTKLEQVIGIMTGSPNVMKVNTEGVFKCLKDMIPTLLDLLWMQCRQVSINCQELSTFANDLYYYFENSSTLRADYKEVQKEEKLPPHDKNNDFFRPVAPHFLYFEAVCQRLLEC